MAEGWDDSQESCSTTSSELIPNDMSELSETINRIVSEVFDNPDGQIEDAGGHVQADLAKILDAYNRVLRRSAENIAGNEIIMDRQELECQTLGNNIHNAVQGIISDYPRYREECDTESLKAIIAERVREVVSMIEQSFKKRGIEDDFKAPAPKRFKRDKSKSPKRDDPDNPQNVKIERLI